MSQCRNPQGQPTATKALIHDVSLTRCYGKPYTITYSYDIAPYVRALSNEIIAEGHVAKVEDVLVMSNNVRELFKKALQTWEAVANVKFIETNRPDVLVFSYHPTGALAANTNGFAKLPGSLKRFIGISTKIDANLNSPFAMHVMLHELGHIAGLTHPWIKKLLKSPFHNTTAFSIMNYYHEYAVENQLLHLPVYPTTPMPVDIRAMQFIFGANQETNAGNQTYYLSEYAPKNRLNLFDYDAYTTISSLPWDANGQDTFSAEGLSDDVVMNMRSNGVSKIHHAYTATPFIELENVVSGEGCHAIVLNPSNNHVNITRSRLSLLFFAPPNTGKDTVVGFNPKHDKIIIEQSITSTQLSWAISLDVSSTPNCNTTLLKFNDNHFVRLIGVHPSELIADSIVIGHAYNATESSVKQARRYMRDLMSVKKAQELESLLESLSMLGKISGNALALSGSSLILHIVFQKYHLLQNHLALSNMVAASLPLVLTGEFKSAGMTVVTQFMFDESSALHFTAGIMLGSIALQSSSITDFAINVAQAAAVAATGYVTSKLTFWAYEAVVGESESAAQPAALAPNHK